MLHVISWSGGKDSTATVILMHLHQNEILREGDEVVILFSEILFDKKNNISGHNPDNIKFIYEKKKIFESWGFRVEILHANGKYQDYLDVFYHKLTRSPSPERIGLTHGFVPSGICAVKRELKLKPMQSWRMEHGYNMVEYVGIAIDEPKRLESLHKENKLSLLERYEYTEEDAKNLCIEYDMLLPQYTTMKNGKKMQNREGCWFCPNAKLCEHKAIKEALPKAWKKYVSLEDTPNLAYPKWNPYSKDTLHQRDELLTYGYKQRSIFEIAKPEYTTVYADVHQIPSRNEVEGQLSIFDIAG